MLKTFQPSPLVGTRLSRSVKLEAVPVNDAHIDQPQRWLLILDTGQPPLDDFSALEMAAIVTVSVDYLADVRFLLYALHLALRMAQERLPLLAWSRIPVGIAVAVSTGSDGLLGN